MKIEDTIIMLTEENAQALSPQTLGGTGVLIQIYTGDAEGLFEAALMAGAKEIEPIKEQFYGDRSGRVIDPFGHQWIIATHIEDVPARELQKRFHELYS
jgi:PhnB protein